LADPADIFRAINGLLLQFLESFSQSIFVVFIEFAAFELFHAQSHVFAELPLPVLDGPEDSHRADQQILLRSVVTGGDLFFDELHKLGRQGLIDHSGIP